MTAKKPRRAKKKRPYDVTRRREQAASTREDIVAAAAEILKTGVRPEQVSFAQVARRAGVAIRTVYRHFAEPGDLLRAVAARTLASFTLTTGLEMGAAGTVDQLARLHRGLSAEPAMFRVFLSAPIRSEVRLEARLRAVLQPVLEKVPEQHHPALVAVVELFSSPYAWDVLHSHYGLSAEQITRTCLGSIQAIMDTFVTQPDLFDPDAPLPPFFRS